MVGGMGFETDDARNVLLAGLALGLENITSIPNRIV